MSVLGIKYAQNVRKQFCKSVASAVAVTAPTPTSKREAHRTLHGNDAMAAVKAATGRTGSKRKRLSPDLLGFRKVDHYLYASTWSAAVVGDGGDLLVGLPK